MQTIEVSEKAISYEVLGEGTDLVWTPGGFYGIETARPVAEAFASLGYRVFIYDRPTTGASDLVFRGENLFAVWARHVRECLTELEMLPAVVGGGSGGMLTSLAFGQLFPDDVSILLLVSPPTDDMELIRGIAEETFLKPAQLAEDDGMHSVIEHGGGFFNWQEQTNINIKKNDQLVSMDAQLFASVMRRWYDAWLGSNPPYFAGLTRDALLQMSVDSVIVSGPTGDEAHPTHTAEALHKLLGNSELELWADHFSSAETETLLSKGGEYCDAALVPILHQYIQKAQGDSLSR